MKQNLLECAHYCFALALLFVFVKCFCDQDRMKYNAAYVA